MTLPEMLERAAARHPAAEAVVDGAARLTYADLARLATRAGAGFARLGVRHGDRVLLALRNRVEHVLAYWGLQTIGAIAVPVNFRLAAEEMQYVLHDAGAKVVVFERSTADAVMEAARSADAQRVFVGPEPPPGVL
ncbi:MAG: AMP-binding protein, partial [Candidatus Rokubacteria bacterium]|nr:AMP-binding protein [Candidatus Rokubacteria bacterium]